MPTLTPSPLIPLPEGEGDKVKSFTFTFFPPLPLGEVARSAGEGTRSAGDKPYPNPLTLNSPLPYGREGKGNSLASVFI